MTTTSSTRRELITTLSSTGFAVCNFGLKTVTGTVPITSAWIDVDAAGTPTAVHASLDLGSLDTGNARRDRDLRKPSLLDLDRYPTLIFSGRPHRTDQHWTVRGTVQAHGTSTPITLNASVSEGADGSMTVHAAGQLDRRALAVHAPRFMIGRLVKVSLNVTFSPPRPHGCTGSPIEDSQCA
jgi:polyisoprenoid-binding protein YceI